MIKRFDRLGKEELAIVGHENHGKEVLIIVHPYFTGDNFAFKHFLQTKEFEKNLTIILQPYDSLRVLFDRLSCFGVENSNSLFVVPTKIVGPKGDWEYIPTPTSGWQRLLARLEAVGAKSITVDGRFLTIGSRGETKKILKRFKTIWTKDDKSNLRTMLRASKRNLLRKDNGGCVGIAWSKIKSSREFKPKITQRFN